MGSPNSGLSIAQQMIQDGSLPDKADHQTPMPMRAVVLAASATNPDAEAKTQQLAQRAGMPVDLTRFSPQAAQQRATAADLDRRELEIRNPILARQLQDPNFAAVAHDDLDSLSGIEQQRNAMNSPLQAQIDDRDRAAQNDGLAGELWSAVGHFNAGVTSFFKPYINAAGVLAENTWDTGKALVNKAAYGPNVDLMQNLQDIWVNDRSHAIQKITEPAAAYLTSRAKQGPQQYLQTPGGKTFENPDYHWYNARNLVNIGEELPGQLAAMYATGGLGASAEEAAGVSGAATEGLAGGGAGVGLESKGLAAVLGTQAAQNTYADARSKGADQPTAIRAALMAGITNYQLMGTMPGGVPATSLGGAAGQWAGRSAAMGTTMALSDNAIAKSYDPERGLFEGIPQSIATMSAFEGVGAISNIVGLAADSKLRARSPEKFQEAMTAILGDAPSVRIPVQAFDDYFEAQKMDPVQVAQELGVKNIVEGKMASDVYEIPTDNFTAALDPKHQQALLPDIIDPVKGVSIRQYAQSVKELQDFTASDGPQKLMAELQAADAETQATPEWKAVHDDLKQRYVDAGEKEPVAESNATLHANAIASLAKRAGLKPDELLAMHTPNIVAGEAPEGAEAGAEGGVEAQPKYQAAIEGIRSVVEAARQPGHAPEKAVIAQVDPVFAAIAKEQGHEIDGFNRVIDGSAVRHTLNKHGNEKLERQRGQVPVTEDDFEKIPQILASPDFWIFGTKSSIGRDQIVSVKRMPDGSTVYIEEVRRRNKELATASMWKYPATMDVNRIESAPHHYVRGDSENEPIVVRNPGAGKSGILYQSGNPISGVEGRQSTLLTPNGKLPATYRLVEAADLIPSHHPETFAVNKDYPEGVQERAYDQSKEAQARVISQSQPYDPETGNGFDPSYLVNTNPDAVNGPPVITPDGTVLGGNSRAMTIDRVYKAGRGEEYKSALRGEAAGFGLNPEDVDGMKEPVLVRQVEAPQSVDAMRRLGSDLNRSMTGALGAAEKAVSAGKNIKPETLRWVSDELNAGDMTLREMLASRGADVLKRFVEDGALTERERPQYIDAATGGLNDAGKSFVEKALLGTVIDDPRLMESAPKSIVAKVERSLGAITSFAARADAWNILPALREAINEHGAIQRGGSSVDLRLGQTSLFGEERNPVVDSLVRALDSKPNAVKEAFDAYAHDSDENMPGQARMFGEAKAFDAFNHAFGSKLSEEEFVDGLDAADKSGAGTSSPGALHTDAEDHGDLPVASAGDTGGSGAEPAAPAEDQPGPIQQELDSLPDHPYAHQEPAPPESPRGWFRMLPDGRYEMGKTRIGDFSTFVHEPAHAYLEMFRELTQREGASDPLKDDFKKICDWLGTTPEEAWTSGFTTEQHEQWARANEQYVREGNAPASGLKRAFQNFAVWLGSIYRRAPHLGVELSAEIRGVMDRLYAGDDAVNRAGQEAPRRLFDTPQEAGWTDAEYKSYAESKGLEVSEAKTQLIREMHEAWLREKTETWREEKANVRDAVTTEVDARPEYTAIRSLRRGKLDDGSELTMNRDALVKQFGEERVKDLQKLHPGLYRTEGGTDAETAAEILGYGSGEEMMRTLQATQRRAPAIEAATRDTMTAKHGDIRYDGSLDAKARLAMENDERAKNVHGELKTLRARVAVLEGRAADQKAAMASIKIAPLESYREAARQMVDAKSLADLQPGRYLDASRRYSREAFDAVRRGDAQRAEVAKNKELLNHFLFREASAARDYAGKFESYAKRMQSRGIQQRLGLADAAVKKAGEVGDYRDQHNWLLARYMLSAPMQAPERSLRAWAEDMNSQLKEPAIPDGILNEGRFADYRRVPLSEVRDLHDALVNVKKLATSELEASVTGKRLQFEQMAQELVAEMRTNLKSKPEKFFEQPMTALEKARDVARSVDVSASRMEFLIDKAGGGLRGAWRKYIWEPYQNAKGDEYAMQADWTKRLNDQIEAESERQGLRLSDKVTVEGIPDSEMLTRKELVSIALNMGNESNRDRLEKTFIARNYDPRAVDRIGGMLTAEEWRFVQAVGDSLKPWGERMNAFEKEQSGLAPKMVEVKPFKVVSSDGVEMNLDGWYFPVKYDPRYVLKGQEEESSKIARSLIETGYGRATTSRGYTKERTGYAGPLLLDYERVLTDHIAKVTKDLSHREFMQNTYRLLTHPDVRQAMRECWGPKYDQEAVSWLRATVNDRNGSLDGGTDDMRYMEALRSNLVKASLAFKASTTVLQFTHLSRLMLFTKPGSYTQAMVDFWKNPAKMTETIRELSPNVMRFRGEHLDRDYNATLKEIAGKKDRISAAVRVGYAPMKYIDHAISFPLWLSVYNDTLLKNGPEMDAGESHTAAMHAADSAVRMGLGDASKGDLPPIMRSPDMLKKIESTLHGFENVNYNIMRHKVAGEAQRSWRAGNYASAAGKLTFGAAMAFFVPAILSAYARGDGPKDDENWGLWAAKRSLFFAGGTIPWVKDGISLFEHGSLNPLASWAQRLIEEGKETAREGELDWKGLGIDSMQAIGDTLGMPGTDQAAHMLRYWHRASQGKIEKPRAYGAIVGGH